MLVFASEHSPDPALDPDALIAEEEYKASEDFRK